MAVQAQYPSSVLLLNNRGEQELKDMDYPQAPPGFIDQSAGGGGGGGGGGAVFFTHNGANGNGRKRMREAAAAAAPPQLFSLQPAALPSPTFISLAQLHNQAPPPALVSTGLRLALEEQNQSKHNNNNNNPMLSSSSSSASTSLLSTVLTDDLAAQLAQQKDEMDQFLLAQGEQLRRAVAERRQRHYRAMLDAAEGAAGRRLREKEAEVERAARRGAELEDRIARLRAESMAWQAKAMAEQATAAALHAQLQQAAAAASASVAKGGDECGESPAADDEGSAYVDPRRAERERACRACRTRPASVVLLPCRHLCLCSVCDSAASGGGVAQTCPVCNCLRTGGVQVFLS